MKTTICPRCLGPKFRTANQCKSCHTETKIKGRKVSTATKKQLSETRKRLFQENKIKVWNKGLTKEDSRVLKNSSGGSSQTQFKPGPRPKTIGKGNANWKGGIVICGGYVFLRRPEHPCAINNGYVGEHRLIMEKHLGRFLNTKEIVHHINHNSTDNRIENLMLLNQSQHSTLHMRERWRIKNESKRFVEVYN